MSASVDMEHRRLLSGCGTGTCVRDGTKASQDQPEVERYNRVGRLMYLFGCRDCPGQHVGYHQHLTPHLHAT